MFRRTSLPRLTAAAAIGLLAIAACSNEKQADAAPPATTLAKAEVTTPATIADFTLNDQNGQPHELYKMTDAKAIVMILQGVGCPIVQQLTPDIKDLQAAYESKGVKFMMLNANNQDTPAEGRGVSRS